jgi:hypothetical protein
MKKSVDNILPDPGFRAYNFNPPVEIGQTWVRIDSLNPFKPIEYDTIIVIDMKGKYSKVIWNGYVTSMETKFVNYDRKLVKKSKFIKYGKVEAKNPAISK